MPNSTYILKNTKEEPGHKLGRDRLPPVCGTAAGYVTKPIVYKMKNPCAPKQKQKLSPCVLAT
jgi:hypothetical protein